MGTSAEAHSECAEIVDPGWARALAPVGAELHAMDDFLRAEDGAGRQYLPARDNVMRAFAQPFAQVKVLIIGQDPYPSPGHAIGLSFAVDAAVRPLPRSLKNIYRELSDDLGISVPEHGDLRPWTKQGVLLLNRCLTVRPGSPASHRAKGWEIITDQAIKALVARESPLVAILWGRDAQALEPLLESVVVLKSAHPSPLSASRGFFGSRPFSRANTELEKMGAETIDWTLP